MHAAVPSEGPRFYLYLLLLHIPGAKSFENLVTVQMPDGTPKICFEPDSNDAAGVVRDTHIPDYRRAAEERGLISTDDEYEEALREAAQYRSAPALRHLFALMLLHCELTKPADLFDTLYSELSEDYLKQRNAEEAYALTLLSLQDTLGQAGRTLTEFHLPLPPAFDDAKLRYRELDKETSYNREKEREHADSFRQRMNEAQANAFDAIVKAFHANEPAFFHRWTWRHR